MTQSEPEMQTALHQREVALFAAEKKKKLEMENRGEPQQHELEGKLADAQRKGGRQQLLHHNRPKCK